MKKILSAITILGIVFLLPGCDFPEYYNHTVKNESESKTISYTFNGSDVVDILAPDESKEYQSKTGKLFKGIANVSAGSPHGFGVSVIVKLNGNDFTFIDVDPFNLNVINTLPFEVTIKADNYIDLDGSTELTIEPYPEEATAIIYTSAKIYTSNPKFTSSTNPLIKFDWTFDKDTDTVYVTIR